MSPCFFGQDIDNGLLERCRQIGLIGAVQPAVLGDHSIARAQDGGFEPRKAEIAAGLVEQRAGQVKPGAALAVSRGFFHGGAAGLAQADEASDLVKRLARGVVDGAAQAPERNG